jgi:hypothetical protein
MCKTVDIEVLNASDKLTWLEVEIKKKTFEYSILGTFPRNVVHFKVF